MSNLLCETRVKLNSCQRRQDNAGNAPGAVACGINHLSETQPAGSERHPRLMFIQHVFHTAATCFTLQVTPLELKHTLYLDGPFSVKSQSCNINRDDRSVQSHQRPQSKYNLQFGPLKISVIAAFYCPWTVSVNIALSSLLLSLDDSDLCPSCKYPPVTWFQNKEEPYLVSYPCAEPRVEAFPKGPIYHHVIYRLYRAQCERDGERQEVK